MRSSSVIVKLLPSRVAGADVSACRMPDGHNTRTTSADVRGPRPNDVEDGAIAGEEDETSRTCRRLPALISTDSIPPHYALAASLTAPSSGYELTLDGFQLDALTMHVYLRLAAPAEGEIDTPVLTDLQQSVALGTDVGNVVNVYLMRTQRGAIGVDVYRLMAQLPVAGEDPPAAIRPGSDARTGARPALR